MNKTIKNTYTTHILITDNEHYNNRCQYWMSVTESTTYDLRIQENNGKWYYQIKVQQLWNMVTYFLRVGRGQKTIRSLLSNETQSHTPWGQGVSENHQITVWQLCNTVTYMLRAGRGQKTIRSMFSSCETQSHTSWGQEEVRKPSHHCSAAMKHSHIHAEGRNRSENHQITIQQLWNTVTYTLRAGTGQKTIRSLFSSYEIQSHTR